VTASRPVIRPPRPVILISKTSKAAIMGPSLTAKVPTGAIGQLCIP
jgi:hypothetical protein